MVELTEDNISQQYEVERKVDGQTNFIKELNADGYSHSEVLKMLARKPEWRKALCYDCLIKLGTIGFSAF